MQTDPEVVASIFVDYYEELLGRKCESGCAAHKGVLQNGPILSVAQQVKLLRPYTTKDAETVMFEIDSNKSPGPDGYGSGFFKATWNVIGEDISCAILDFFNNGKLLTQFNTTMITLIPKVKVPENASQYRPISCCNVVYKCISKMICKRLKKGH